MSAFQSVSAVKSALLYASNNTISKGVGYSALETTIKHRSAAYTYLIIRCEIQNNLGKPINIKTRNIDHVDLKTVIIGKFETKASIIKI